MLAVDDGGALTITGYDLAAAPTVALSPIEDYVGRYPVRLTALFYRTSFEALGLEPGPQPLLPAGQELALGDDPQRAEIRGAETEGWRPLLGLDPPLSEVYLPAPDPSACLGLGGCYIEENERIGACVVPCPAPTAVAAPEPPRPPALRPCRPGWREVESDGIEVCEPWPESGRGPCPAGEVVFPGAPGCAPVGRACSGDYADPLPPGPIRYVDPGAAAGGDGSLATPYRTIAAASSGAGPGTVLALRRGTYAEDVTLGPGVQLVGACAKETILTPTGVGLRTTGLGAEAHDLTIRGGTAGVEVRQSGRSLRVSGLVIEGTRGDALTVDQGARLEVERTLVQDTGGSYFGQGEGILEQVVIARSVGTGIFGTTGRLTMEDVAIVDGQPDANGSSRGLAFQGDVQVTANGLVVEANRGIGLLPIGAQVTLRDAVIRGTRFEPKARAFGDGVQVGSGAVLRAQRLWVKDNQRYDVMVTGPMAQLSLIDGVITDALPSDDGLSGSGLFLQGTASASVARTFLARTHSHAVLLNGLATNLELTDVVVEETLASADDGSSVSALRVEQGARVKGSRLHFRNISGQGVAVRDAGSTSDLTDVVVDDTGAGECHSCSGICVDKGASLEHLERARVTGARGRGVWASGAASVLLAFDLEVSQSAASGACVNNNPASAPRFGDGLAAVDGAEVRVERFFVHDNPAGGLVVEEYIPDDPTVLWAKDGRVEHNGTGARLVAGYDARRVALFVVYRDNQVPIGD